MFLVLTVLAGVLLLMPEDAFCWGPGMHIFIGYLGLDAQVSGTIAGLVINFRREFLWGLVMADLVIGKNLSSWRIHPHNWQFILELFEKAPDPKKKAFMLGYMSHLTHDVIAHNVMIPYLLVESAFKGKRLNHFSIEVRAESLVPSNYFDEILDMLRDEKLEECTLYLEENLKSTILPMTANKKVFFSALKLNAIRRKAREKLARIYKRKTESWLDEMILRFARESATLQTIFLAEFPRKDIFELDPTGSLPLSVAESLGKIARRHPKNTKEMFIKALFQFVPPVYEILGNSMPGFESL